MWSRCSTSKSPRLDVLVLYSVDILKFLHLLLVRSQAKIINKWRAWTSGHLEISQNSTGDLSNHTQHVFSCFGKKNHSKTFKPTKRLKTANPWCCILDTFSWSFKHTQLESTGKTAKPILELAWCVFQPTCRCCPDLKVGQNNFVAHFSPF